MAMFGMFLLGFGLGMMSTGIFFAMLMHDFMHKEDLKQIEEKLKRKKNKETD